MIQTLLLHHLPRSLAKLCSLSESESIFSSIQQTSGCSEVCTSRNYMIIHKVKPNFVHIINSQLVLVVYNIRCYNVVKISLPWLAIQDE